MTSFDRIIVTSANKRQAEGYKAVLKHIKGPKGGIFVVPDPGGKRVGSLLATVNALNVCGIESNKLTLICHSGGDSKRLPSYAAIGKAFVPLYAENGSRESLFEKIVSNMSKLNLPKKGVLVVCGDVAPQFDFSSCTFASKGVTGVAFKGDKERASKHGVYILEGRGVKGFLQKPSPEEALRTSADGEIAIDTGILYLSPEAVDGMMKKYLPYLESRHPKEMDIYQEYTLNLVSSKKRFEANLVEECDFFHIGTTKELLERLGGGQRWVDACAIPAEEMKLAGRNVVTFVPREYGEVNLKEGECLTAFPLKSGEWKYLKYRVEDDFKSDGLWQKHSMDEVMSKTDRKAMLRLANEVEVSLPLRIDFAGGWSDTPPICNEVGGAVLNAAVTLAGKKPVKARVRKIPAKELRIKSVDLRKSQVLKKREEIYSVKDPSDWCALVKSALAVIGYEFEEGGLDISISADVPKGSGMGTSSLLGAALLTALERVRGRDASPTKIGSLTLALEHEMGTNGGWQDQYGGLLPGIKLLTTQPGDKQVPEVKFLPKDAEIKFAKWLKQRSLLYFTGQKRMARNILRGVVSFYKENPGEIASKIVSDLKIAANSAYEALQNQDFPAFADILNKYWLLKKALDPGSTNDAIESLLARISPYTRSAFLCGAGGGGFMFIIAKSPQAKEKIKLMLEMGKLHKSGSIYDFQLVVNQ